MRRNVVSIVFALVAALTGCGVLQPTPARFRPALPPAEPLPNLRAEDLIAELEHRGFECQFDPGGDIPSGWSCARGDVDGGDYLSVGMRSGDTGPIEAVGASRSMGVGAADAPDPATLDRDAATSFHEVLIELVVPEELRPTMGRLLDSVQRNYPVELGDGWFLGFDRNSRMRSVNVVYSTAGD